MIGYAAIAVLGEATGFLQEYGIAKQSWKKPDF